MNSRVYTRKVLTILRWVVQQTVISSYQRLFWNHLFQLCCCQLGQPVKVWKGIKVHNIRKRSSSNFKHTVIHSVITLATIVPATLFHQMNKVVQQAVTVTLTVLTPNSTCCSTVLLLILCFIRMLEMFTEHS